MSNQLAKASRTVPQGRHSKLASWASGADLPNVGSVVAGGERAAVVRHGGDQVERRARVRAVAVHPARVDAARAGQDKAHRSSALNTSTLCSGSSWSWWLA